MGGPQCHMSILRNGNVAYISLIFHTVTRQIQENATSHVTIFLPSYPMSPSPMSHVKFKKRPWRHINFRGHGPFVSTRRSSTSSSQGVFATLLGSKFLGTPKFYFVSYINIP